LATDVSGFSVQFLVVRRKGGNELVPNEVKVLGVALRLLRRNVHEFHGYEVLKELEAIEGGRLRDNSTIYRALRRLETQGLLQSDWETPEAASAAGRENRPRRYYQVTGVGMVAAPSALVRMAAEPKQEWVGGLLKELGLA